jgi:excisionase family DNA binding protein
MQADFCDIDEAVRLTGWTRATLYSKASRRQIPSYRIGRSLRFRRSDLLRLFRARPALRPLAPRANPSDGENGGER